MNGHKSQIIADLQRDINRMQGSRPAASDQLGDVGLGPINKSFPEAVFPLGVMHEFLCHSSENTAATVGFVSGIVGKLMKENGICIWTSMHCDIFPPALTTFNIDPSRIIFLNVKNRKDLLWTIEETLKCNGLVSIVGELPELNFTDSRRLQLAGEQSRVTGFILRKKKDHLTPTASATRWLINSMPALIPEELPGVGFPRWSVELLKVRNGKPGSWTVVWKSGKFRFESRLSTIPVTQKRKTG